MDQKKIGKFLADLRKGEGLTQEALGERIGVTNKTVSRWENGNYMPDIEMLQILSQELHVTVNELLAGERLSEEEFKKKAEENIISAAKASSFSFEERKAYFQRKWHREHLALLFLCAAVFLAAIVVPVVLGKPWFASLTPILGMVEHGYLHNKMMIYVEHKLYD